MAGSCLFYSSPPSRLKCVPVSPGLIFAYFFVGRVDNVLGLLEMGHTSRLTSFFLSDFRDGCRFDWTTEEARLGSYGASAAIFGLDGCARLPPTRLSPWLEAKLSCHDAEDSFESDKEALQVT